MVRGGGARRQAFPVKLPTMRWLPAENAGCCGDRRSVVAAATSAAAAAEISHPRNALSGRSVAKRQPPPRVPCGHPRRRQLTAANRSAAVAAASAFPAGSYEVMTSGCGSSISGKPPQRYLFPAAATHAFPGHRLWLLPFMWWLRRGGVDDEQRENAAE